MAERVQVRSVANEQPGVSKDPTHPIPGNLTEAQRNLGMRKAHYTTLVYPTAPQASNV